MSEPTASPAGGPKNPVWQSRTTQAAHPLLSAMGNSTQDDKAFASDDLAGSIAHVAGLHHAGLITRDEATALIEGLQGLQHDLQNGQWHLDPSLEDIHMNIEAALKDRLGTVADKLHTGRSRNDQVATAITLYARRNLLALIESLSGLEENLLHSASAHLGTPWTATTHGQPAQPATIGYLLAAHAVRTSRAVDHLLGVLEALDECPLGAGAVAGSTLPLEPEVPATLLGLQPLENALVSSGTRDNVLAALGATTHIAPVLSALVTDLLKLHEQGEYNPPQGLTTGSSLMPQKRNPDALELACGHAHSLPTHEQHVHQILLGLGLGYQRDLQLTKPVLVKALDDAITTTLILAAHIRSACFTPDSNESSHAQESTIAATDVAETLVKNGIPFRTAYHWVAQAAAMHEQHATPLVQALETILHKHDVAPETIAACKTAWVPDPERRITRGAPAPQRVGETIARLTLSHEKQLLRLEALAVATEKPVALLVQPPDETLGPAQSDDPPHPLETEPVP